MIKQAVAVPTFRPFHPSDALAIVNRDGEQSSTWNIVEQARNGPSFTMIAYDQPILLAGMVFPWAHVGQCWMIVGENVADYALQITRTVKGFLDHMTRLHHLHRVEAVALHESIQNQKWLEAIGFTREEQGIAQAYLADGRSMVRYERIGG